MIKVSAKVHKDELLQERAPKRLKYENSDYPTNGRSARRQQGSLARDATPPLISNSPETGAKVKVNNSNISQIKEIITKYISMPVIPENTFRLAPLSGRERLELELALQLDFNSDNSDGDGDGWHEDWSGNLALMTKGISNPLTKRRKAHKTEVTLSLLEWAQQRATQSVARRLGRNLLAHVSSKAPPMAQQILSHMSQMWEKDPIKFDIYEALKRCSYDPKVLSQDGWTTAPASPDTPLQGRMSNGPMHIGKHIDWQGYEAVVIAYVHDNDLGDLWKAMWIDGFETFDLEEEELQAASKKWDRKFKRKVIPNANKAGRPRNNEQHSANRKRNGSNTVTTKDSSAMSSRFASSNIEVKDIDYGVIMARTYNPNARQSLFWPARVMHPSEVNVFQTHRKRSSAKHKVNVVFLAPYWQEDNRLVSSSNINGLRVTDYSSLPLFQMESIDASSDTIQNYTFDSKNGIDFNRFKMAFRFTGLPKGALGRWMDAHRLALALQMYAKSEMIISSAKPTKASAALFDTHPLALKAPRYPPALLHLPFEFILSKLRPNNTNEHIGMEPTIHLRTIMNSMEPPLCHGIQRNGASDKLPPSNDTKTKQAKTLLTIDSPICKVLITKVESSHATTANLIDNDYLEVDSITSNFIREELTKLAETDLSSASLLETLEKLLSRCKLVIKTVTENTIDKDVKILKLRSLLQEVLRVKSYGEDVLAADASLLGREIESTLIEWRKACERLFKIVTVRCSSDGFGNSVTVVLSDSRCNQHITKEGCAERAVRLPVALKAAKLAGAGSSSSFPLQVGVEDYYIKLATDKFIEKAHTVHYLKKMKARCSALPLDAKGAHLTEGSDGEGGLDTTGARGTYDAAIAGVAAAMKAVDMIVGGRCVNAFCATRPPGHHAGRGLHPMGAISNGFCILNPVACAAIYATTSSSQGGLGLKRAVVIDFDAHHGNGTQDILCSTYDPRFLYISMHAGGATINGSDESDDPENELLECGGKKQEGIFPGRCGDTSPHKGVINIPLGPRIKPHDVGSALINIIEPSVENFSPDIIILSAGFDGHKNDPLNLGGLSAQDFGHITEVACGMAFRFCSGRIFSVLEGGYGIPCCRPQRENLFLPPPPPAPLKDDAETSTKQNTPNEEITTDGMPIKNKEEMIVDQKIHKRQQPSKLLQLDDLLPDEMDDQVTPAMQRKLEKCHVEGFIDCVREHVTSLKENNARS